MATDINRTTSIALPGEVSSEILQKTQESSAVMALARSIKLPGLGTTIPIITGDPQPTLDDVKEKFEQALEQGSREKMAFHEFCDRMQIPFEKISSEDFSAFLRILSLSKLLKNPNNMRGKARPIYPNRKARRKRK